MMFNRKYLLYLCFESQYELFMSAREGICNTCHRVLVKRIETQREKKQT
jgi:hypothetical protein